MHAFAGLFAVPTVGVVLCSAATSQRLIQTAVRAPQTAYVSHVEVEQLGSEPHGAAEGHTYDSSCTESLVLAENSMHELVAVGVVAVLDLRTTAVPAAKCGHVAEAQICSGNGLQILQGDCTYCSLST